MKQWQALSIAIAAMERRQTTFAGGHFRYLDNPTEGWEKEDHEDWLEFDEAIKTLKAVRDGE